MASANADESKLSAKTRHQNISEGIIQSLQKVWDDHEFEDFKVYVDGETFSCHSLILASCSEFFRGLLRSNMREKKEMRVELNNISSSTFRLIINALYSGYDFLTKEVILKVWSAVHQLQIQFLIEHCENFVINNLSLDNVEMFKEQTEYLQSEKVKPYIFNCILKHFEQLRKNNIFLQLEFDYLIRLIESDKLNVNSEDLVMYSILDWVNFGNVCTKISKSNEASHAKEEAPLNNVPAIGPIESLREPNKEKSHSNFNFNSITEEHKIVSKSGEEKVNERNRLLIPLLKATRYYLASEACIEKLSKDKLIQNDLLVKEMLFEACTFKFSNYWHDLWPTSAIHRDCSDLDHFGVYCYDGEISALSLKENKWFSLPNLKTLQYSNLTIFKGKLYACTIGTVDNEIYVLQHGNHWKQEKVLSHTVKLLVTHEQSIYEFDSIENVFIKFNPETKRLDFENISHELLNPEFALSFHSNILVFCSVDNNGLEETAVHCWNTENNTWTQLDNIDFSSKNMISFCSDSNTYILDSNGKMLKLINAEIIGFTFVATLWNVKYNLQGAFLFRERLYIYGDDPNKVHLLKKVEGVFSSSKIWGANRENSNFLHYVLKKGDLKPKK